jgi:hypothetical protein
MPAQHGQLAGDGDGRDLVQLARNSDGRDLVQLPRFQNTTSAKVRWMSMPITRRITCSSSVSFIRSSGRHYKYGSALAAQPGGSQGAASY